MSARPIFPQSVLAFLEMHINFVPKSSAILILKSGCRMPLNREHGQISMIGGLRVRELRHEVLSKKKECVTLYSLESRDGIRAEGRNQRCGSSSAMLSDKRQQAEL